MTLKKSPFFLRNTGSFEKKSVFCYTPAVLRYQQSRKNTFLAKSYQVI